MRPSDDQLGFLDYFCVLFALLYLSSAIDGLHGWHMVAVAAVAAVFVASWFLWRLTSHAALAWFVAAASVAVLLFSNSPVSVMSIWLGIVALALPNRRRAQWFAGLIVVATIGLHLASRSPWTRILVEVAVIVAVVLAGLALARSVTSAIDAHTQLRAANDKLRRSLANSRELALAHERERVATSLHAGLGHRLTTIGLGLDFAARMIERDPVRAREELQRARAATTDALSAMRATVRAMKPVALVDDSLEATLAQLAASFDGTDLTVGVLGADRAAASEEEATLILLFVQEALTNVVRHAGASKAHIALDKRSTVVVDDGRGHEGAPDFGLRSLRDRARDLGGDVTWQPHGGIDGGFRLELILPEVDDD